VDELLTRQIPHSQEAEQAVIGSMLIDPACVPDAISMLHAEDFYIEENRAIFETIFSMFTASEKIDAVTVLEELKSLGLYDNAGGRTYLMQLMDITPTSANMREYAKIVRDKSMLRGIHTAASEIVKIVEDGEGDASDIAELSEQKIFAVRQGREIKGVTHIKSAIKEAYDRIDDIIKAGGKLPGVPTGLSELDNFIGGLNKSDLILLASRPGMGKTSIALNMAMNAAKKTPDKAIVIFQLEMSKEQLATRLLSSEALIDSRKLRMADLTEEDWVKIARASTEISRNKIYIDDNPTITVAEMKAKLRRLPMDIGLVVIDYLQLMQSGKRSENRVQEVSEISRSLKILAKELNVPVLCLSQLSRASEQRSDKRPMLSDLRESGAIEQDADLVLFLYRDDYYNEDTEEKNIAECIVAKNRHGATGTIKLQWLGQFTTFTSQDRIHNEPFKGAKSGR